MKLLALFSAGLVALALASCSDDHAAETSTAPSSSSKPIVRITDRGGPPPVSKPLGLPPKGLIIKDIRRGIGSSVPAKGEVKIRTNFVAVSYRTGKPYEVRWKPSGGFNIEFGPGLEIKGWEKGLVGMKVGGRRELVVPSDLAYKRGALVYVIDLVGVE